MKQAAGLRERQRLGDGAQGAQPDFDRWATQGNRKGEEKEKKKVFHFLKKNKQNSNTGLNSTTKNRCSSMYATVNSFISLI
jgi:hypothetical protein